MARKPRRDGIDTWHHLMNRGIARRTIFETDADRRFFLSLLAREVRAGRIEVHAFSLMLTHFHLLVRSVKGELSKTMQRVQNRYSRWFNRTRKRDGSLYKSRFLSCPIEDLVYRRTVVTYIHDNAVHAGLVADPAHFEWSSAHHYAQGKRPRWLTSSWVDDECLRRGSGETRATRLSTAFASRVDPEFRRWVESNLAKRLPEELEELSLGYAGSPRVVRWAVRKAKLADGTRPFQPYCPPSLVERVVDRTTRRLEHLLQHIGHATRKAATRLRAGLLRMLAGCTHREIGMRLKRHSATICRDLQDHAHLVATDRGYERVVAAMADAVLSRIRRPALSPR